MKDLYNELLTYTKTDVYPFHMPGHKRSGAVAFGDPFEVDITEIDGFDNLHHPEGILREMQEDAARIYGTQQTYFHVNGSSGGILSAIYAVTDQGDEILMARNCHKAVYNAVVLRGLKPHYLYPERDAQTGIAAAIRPDQVAEALVAHPAVKAVVLVSPNYEGVAADVAAIAEVVHGAGAVLVVDEAHGAHLPFCARYSQERFGEGSGDGSFFPQSAITGGADVVIQSLHKTMPALTQTAVVHRCSERVPRERLEEAQRIFQTSSPSYVLMASTGQAIRWGQEEMGEFMAYEGFLKILRESRKAWSCLRMFVAEELGWTGDPGKIVIYDGSGQMNGRGLYEWLRTQYHLQPELCTERYVLLMTAPADASEGFMRLISALKSLDEELATTRSEAEAFMKGDGDSGEVPMQVASLVPILSMVQAMIPAEAGAAPRESVDLSMAEGRIAGEYIYLYPPEIPLLVPGERVSAEFLTALGEYEKTRLSVQGMRQRGQLVVVK